MLRLRDGLARPTREPTDEQIRDGLIERFEFTYELTHKMLRRYLKEIAASPEEIERTPFADLIRSGNAQGLLRGDWPVWRRFREMRARTSHTYDDKVCITTRFGHPGISGRSRALLRRTATAARMTPPMHIKLPADHRLMVLHILRRSSAARAQRYGCSARGRLAGPGVIPISIWRSMRAGGLVSMNLPN